MLVMILVKETIKFIELLQQNFLKEPCSLDIYNTLANEKISLISELIEHREIDDDEIFRQINSIMQVHNEINSGKPKIA